MKTFVRRQMSTLDTQPEHNSEMIFKVKNIEYK